MKFASWRIARVCAWAKAICSAVLAAIREAKEKPRVLLQGSAVGYYGSAPGEILTEVRVPATAGWRSG